MAHDDAGWAGVKTDFPAAAGEAFALYFTGREFSYHRDA
jgi:hypothetical protein